MPHNTTSMARLRLYASSPSCLSTLSSHMSTRKARRNGERFPEEYKSSHNCFTFWSRLMPPLWCRSTLQQKCSNPHKRTQQDIQYRLSSHVAGECWYSNFRSLSLLHHAVTSLHNFLFQLLFHHIQGGSNMTGTNCDLFTHKSSRSYLNHLVLSCYSFQQRHTMTDFPERNDSYF